MAIWQREAGGSQTAVNELRCVAQVKRSCTHARARHTYTQTNRLRKRHREKGKQGNTDNSGRFPGEFLVEVMNQGGVQNVTA